MRVDVVERFFSSGTPEHTQWRQLLDEAGFKDMHKTEWQ